MKQSLKTCIRCGEPRRLYARKMCLACDRLENPDKHGRRINRVSSKRLIINEEYNQLRLLNIEEKKIDGISYCEFCHQRLEKPDTHHVAGKNGLSDNNIPLLLDTRGYWITHRSCHRNFHDLPISEWHTKLWLTQMLSRIKSVSRSKYYGIIKKLQ